MEQEKNEKVLAMYHAVWHLLEDGKDVTKIKVSDITECAGIGKGTAYEYFRSKEELVGKALQFNTSLQVQMLSRAVKEQDSFMGGLEACFDWLLKTRDKRLLVIQFMRRTDGFLQIPDCFSRENEEQKKSFMMVGGEILRELVLLGRKEGAVRREIPDDLAALQILSQLLGFFVRQEFADFSDEAGLIKTKEFLCDNIIKSLS